MITTMQLAPTRRNRLMIAVGAVFLAVGLILGTVSVLIGSEDYSAYTARANATVVDIDVHTSKNSSGKTATTTDYDVQFTVDGQTYRVEDIGGVRSGGNLSTGDVVVVAFPPGQPEQAVWASTVEGGARILLWIGLGVGLLFGLLGAVILILGLRRSPASAPPVAAGSSLTGPVADDPGAAADIGRPWTFDEVVGDLVRRTAGTPYAVDRAGHSVTVRVDLADARWWALLQRQGLTASYSTTLTPVGAAKAARADAQNEFEWAAGPDGRLVPRLTGQAASVGGRVWSVGSQQIWALGPDGVRKVVDYRLDSGELQALIKTTLDRAGWSTALDTQAKIGLWAAAIGALGAVAAGVAVLLF